MKRLSILTRPATIIALMFVLHAGADSAGATVRPAIPPGFDGGNQTVAPLARIAANVNVSALGNTCYNPMPAKPTDDVKGPHTGDTPIPLVAFGGVNANCVTPGPPDTQIAAGGNFVIEDVNAEMAIFDRAGNLVKAVSNNSFFGVSSTCDPRIAFDPLPSPHWYATTLEGCNLDSGDSVDIAVSHTADPTGLWDIYRVFKAATNHFADQPRLGFSLNKVLIDFTQSDKHVFCVTCFDDVMVVVEKGDLVGLTAGPRAIDINMSTETNHRRKIIPAIPLPGAEVPTAFAVYRGSDSFGKYESTLVFVGLPSTGDVAFRETGNKIKPTNNPNPAAQPGVAKNQIDPGREDVQSVSLIKASTSDFSGELWSAGSDKCKVGGQDRVCIRLNRVSIDGSGVASVTFDGKIDLVDNDLLDPAVVGDASGSRVWIADSRTGTIFPTSELRLLKIVGTNMQTIQYGSGAAPYIIDKFTDKDDPRKGLTRFGDYSGIYVDPTQPNGSTVWAATENAAISKTVGFNTSIVQATFNKPAVTSISPSTGFAGDSVDIFGTDFSQNSAVTFGGVPVGPVTFLGSNHLRVKAPEQPPTTVNVTVTTLKGSNTPLPGPPLPFPGVADRFTYGYLLWESGGDHSGDVTAIDPIADKRHFSIKLGNLFGTVGIAMSPDGRTVYATSPLDGTFASIEADNGQVFSNIDVGVAPTEVAVSPDGKWAFVTDPKNTASTGAVIPVALGNGTHPQPQTAIPITDPRGVAAAADGTVYVSSGSDHTISILKYQACPTNPAWCATGTINISTGTPGPMAAGPDRVWLGVTGLPSISPGLVYSIGATTPPLSSPTYVDRAPEAVTVTPDGHTVFAITASGGGAGGWIYPIQHNPPSPDHLLTSYSIPDGPVGGGATSLDSAALYVAGGTSSHINAAGVPGPYSHALVSGPVNTYELATNLPPKTDCGGARWANPFRQIQFSQNPPHKNALVTVTASVMSCPSQAAGPGTATPALRVLPPKVKGCPKSYVLTNPPLTLSSGIVSLTFQTQATCAGKWRVNPFLGNYVGPAPNPPGFMPFTFTVRK